MYFGVFKYTFAWCCALPGTIECVFLLYTFVLTSCAFWQCPDYPWKQTQLFYDVIQMCLSSLVLRDRWKPSITSPFNKLGTWFFRMLGVCLLSQYAWGALAIITCVTSLLGLSRVPSRGSALIPASLSALLLPVHWASLLLPLPDPACPHTTDRGFFLKTPLTKTVWFKA